MITMLPSNGSTAAASRMARYAGWGSAAVSANPALGVVASYELIPRSSPSPIPDNHRPYLTATSPYLIRRHGSDAHVSFLLYGSLDPDGQLIELPETKGTGRA
jgi:hypothetical protein